MEYVRRTYVEFFLPGVRVTETSTKEVESRDPEQLVVPDEVFGFRFFDVLEATVEVGGQQVKLTSGAISKSPMYYYGGRIYTREDVVLGVSDNQVLLDNMDGNDWKYVIRTRFGNFQPFHGEDVLIEGSA